MNRVCFHLTPASADMLRPRLDLVEHSLANFWTHQKQARILCHARPVSFAQRLGSMDVPADWRRRYLLEQRAVYQHLEVSLFAVDTYMALWCDAGTNIDVLEAGLPDALSVPAVQRVPMPQFVRGRYVPRLNHLEPVTPGMPYLSVLTAYAVRGGWAPVDVGVYASWQRLLSLDIPLTLAIDVQTLAPAKAAYTLALALDRRLPPDQHASAAYLQSVLDTESVHLVRYAVLIQARTRLELDRMAQSIAQVTGRRLPLDRLAGMQHEHIKFFQDVPPAAIHTPVTAHNTSSHGVGCKTPIAVRRSVQQHGVLFGTDAQERVPVHYQLFGEDGRQNANAIMLGTSGAGKTVVMQTIALRHAIDGAQVVLMEPADTCWRLRDAVGSDRACAYHSVAETPAINILDPVAGTPIDQRDSIVRKLEVALGKPQEHGGRIRVAPRPLSNREIGAIGRAMEHATLYGANCRELSGMTPTDAPLLHDLVDVLQAQDSAESRNLAAEIADTLLGTAAAIFNTRTTLHFDPAADVSLYSFRGVKPERLPLIYDYLFDTIDAYVWSAARDRTRPVLVFIDEFYYMASVASLEQRVVKASKTWRNRRAALWSADQNAETYFGAGGAAWGPFVTDNTRQKLFFQLEGGADVVANAYRHKLTPAHVDQLRMLRRGQCVAMLDRDVRLLNVELTPLEGRALL